MYIQNLNSPFSSPFITSPFSDLNDSISEDRVDFWDENAQDLSSFLEGFASPLEPPLLGSQEEYVEQKESLEPASSTTPSPTFTYNPFDSQRESTSILFQNMNPWASQSTQSSSASLPPLLPIPSSVEIYADSFGHSIVEESTTPSQESRAKKKRQTTSSISKSSRAKTKKQRTLKPIISEEGEKRTISKSSREKTKNQRTPRPIISEEGEKRTISKSSREKTKKQRTPKPIISEEEAAEKKAIRKEKNRLSAQKSRYIQKEQMAKLIETEKELIIVGAQIKEALQPSQSRHSSPFSGDEALEFLRGVPARIIELQKQIKQSENLIKGLKQRAL